MRAAALQGEVDRERPDGARLRRGGRRPLLGFSAVSLISISLGRARGRQRDFTSPEKPATASRLSAQPTTDSK